MPKSHFPATDYQAIAPTYDTYRKQWEIPRDDVLASMIEEHSGPLTVLDIGCGTGIYMTDQQVHLAGSDVRWVGLDPSSGMLEQALGKGGAVRYVQGVSERIPFRNGAFDYVHSSFCFHHFRDKHTALDEIARVLGPRGCLKIRNVEPWSMPGWWVYEFFPETVEIDRGRFWPVETLVSELERRGLGADVTIEKHRRTIELRDILAESESRTISQHAVLDDAAFARGLQRLRDAIAADPDAQFEGESAVLILTARP